MSIPGFNAEASLCRTKAGYGITGTRRPAPAARGVVPQRDDGDRRCGECSDLFLGTRWCCEGDPLSICAPEPCGLVVAIGTILGSVFSL